MAPADCVEPVHTLGRHPERACACGDLAAGDGPRARRDRPAVVLADEQHRQPPRLREVERLQQHALVHRAVAEEPDPDGARPQPLCRKRKAARHRRARPDDPRGGGEMLSGEQVHVTAARAAQTVL